ncbi:MAG: hypothetical protein Q8919_07145 [Bacteroidota bacterium]|nr:hypothetical protein [Bacteroidota bacterium]
MKRIDNPFEFKFPEEIEAAHVIDLFVPVFGEYYNVPIPGHTFINGPRGSGKSMMFRYMKPDCQRIVDDTGGRLKHPKKLKDLGYFSIFIPIKKGHLNKMDIRFTGNKYGEALLNEHFMVLHFSLFIFGELSRLDINNSTTNRKALIDFHNNIFMKCLRYASYDKIDKLNQEKSIRDVYVSIIETLQSLSSVFQRDYITTLIGVPSTTLPFYKGPLLNYSDFLLEILKGFRTLPFMPDKPIYLLIDDADEMNDVQQKVLNSWVSMRTTNEVSLKISTQLRYKTFTTVNGSRIDTPHDYSEVNLNDIYTTKKDLYYRRVEEIVRKRFLTCNLGDVMPNDFFPSDIKQQQNIAALANKYLKGKTQKGKTPKQAYDFAYRYAVSDFIKSIEGNQSTFSYAGFENLVNISSGVVREFIDFASDMYSAQRSKNGTLPVTYIEASIQDKAIKDYSDRRFYREFEKDMSTNLDMGEMIKLRNLIAGMGGLFRRILRSEASERRVFSIALSQDPDEELTKILNLGIERGFLQKSVIGNKYGTGKLRLYILSRTLSPHFGLDPSSFAGYKFMSPNVLKKALTDPHQFIENLSFKIKGVKDGLQEQMNFEGEIE